MKGSGLMNSAINSLPIELHIPKYSYCGPGTKLKTRLARGDLPLNPLDAHCQSHDIKYAENKDIETRNKADKVLAEEVWNRVKAKDSSIGEKVAAYAVSNIMKVKSKLGMGVRNKKKTKINLKKIITAAKKYMISSKNEGTSSFANALLGARSAVKKHGGKKNIKRPKVIQVPKKIGAGLPLIPIFAGLSALGSLAGGASGIAKAVNQFKSVKEQLKESERHNKMMESIAIGKGIFLAPYKSGSGLYLTPYKQGEGVKKNCIKKKQKIKFTESSIE